MDVAEYCFEKLLNVWKDVLKLSFVFDFDYFIYFALGAFVS